MDATIPVITLDGPGGSGKGTVSRIVAQRLGWHWLDSGALYRLAALAAARHGVALADEADLAALAAHLDVQFGAAPDDTAVDRILLEGEEVGQALRAEACANAASRIAAWPAVRAALLERQHAFRRPPGLVADGRDMGSVVFPDALLKIFLTASPECRAERRYKQLIEKGLIDKQRGDTMSGLVAEIAERDARDTGRTVSPLKAASDAVLLDTSALSIEDVVQRVLSLLQGRLKSSITQS
ncbi:MAG: (d)CMP kinase [Proteobacteria bacterium]|nr:(d)CMP kinase [Pseudomonadota bacterium]